MALAWHGLGFLLPGMAQLGHVWSGQAGKGEYWRWESWNLGIWNLDQIGNWAPRANGSPQKIHDSAARCLILHPAFCIIILLHNHEQKT